MNELTCICLHIVLIALFILIVLIVENRHLLDDELVIVINYTIKLCHIELAEILKESTLAIKTTKGSVMPKTFNYSVTATHDMRIGRQADRQRQTDRQTDIHMNEYSRSL